MRVTTVALKWVPQNSFAKVIAGFDQEAAAVLMARYAIFKAETEHLFDVLRWLDRSLIRFIAKFAEYQKDNPQSLTIASNFSLFPQFMYHLRRSQFLRVFNTSPDETTFFRMALNRETVGNSLIMIQPTLFSYSLNERPHPVLLDALSVVPNAILLLDTYFQVLIHYGETIVEWRDADYQSQDQYKHFKALLEMPKEDAKKLLKSRYPFPKTMESDPDGSDDRYLKAKINPSLTHHSQQEGYVEQGSVVLTDDASLQDFMTGLKQLAVTQ
jgi:protein transport protein SEC23